MSSLNRLLNEDAPSLALPPPPSPSSSAASSFPASALDFLAEAAMAGIGGASAPPPAAAVGLVDSSRMDGVEPANGSNKPAAAAAPSKQYHLDSSFFPAAPEPSFLPPPQQQRAAFSFPVQQPSSSNSNANGHLTNGQYNPVPNFNFAATAAAQQAQAQGQGHPSSSSSDPSDVPIPAHLLAWGAEEPLSAAERVKMGRRRVPTVPAPAPAAPSGPHPPSNNNHHAHAPQQQHSSHNSHSSSHQQQQQHHAHNSSSNHSHSQSHQQQQHQHQQQQAHNPYSNSSSSSSVPQHSHNPLGLLPMLPKKEKKAIFVPPPVSHSMHQGGGQSSSSMMSGGGTPNGMVRQGYQGERTTSIGSEGGAGASASDSGTNTSGGGGGNVQGQGHPVGPDGQPIVKTGRKRVLGPDGKPMKKVKVPGRGQAWRKGLGGVGTGSAAPKLSTPLELFTAPSGPPRPKKPKKIKSPEDANGGSGSGSANGNGGGNNNHSNHSNQNNNHNNNHGGGGGGGGSHNFNNHGNDPSGSHHGNGAGGGGNTSMPPGEKLPKAPKPKVSKPGTHPKKAMPKFGPELPPNWIPTNLPIAQRPRDPTPPPVVLAVVEEEDDQAVYCICETKYDEDKAMMACDKCQEWYHPECVNISEEKIELVDQFVCPKCEHLTEDRTTWKVKCRSQGCFRPIIPPLTKYCSPSCGVTHLTALAAAQAVPLVSLLPRSTYARRPGGTTVAAEQAVPAPLAPALSSSPSSGAAYPPSYPSSPEDANGQHPLLTTLHASLESVEKDIKESKNKVEVVGKRLELLGRASERAEKIEELEKARKAALAVEEEELKKKELLEKEGEAKKEEEEGVETGEEKMEAEEVEKPSKASKGKKPEAAGNAAGERVCGFDRRLVFGEREFEEWCATEEGKKALAGEEELVKVGEDVVMKEEGAGERVEGGWWCEETRKKCDGHAGWQRWRLVDFQMEQQQKEETLSKLEKKRDGVKKEIADLEQEVEARRRLDLKPHSSNSNGFVALPTSNERGGVAIPASERRGSFNANGLSVPSALYTRGGSVGGGQSSSLETKGSYGSLYGFSNERGGFSSNERGGSGGGFSSERGGFSNERGGVSNERGGAGDEDVEMDL